MNNLLKIAVFTLGDQLKHKSFYLLLAISILFVFMIRGCYQGEYVVNGRQIDNDILAWHVSKIVFQVVAAGMFFLASLLSMKIFSRDHGDGSMTLFLSRPLSRWQYVLGRIAGTWLICLALMFSLHLVIFWTAWTNTGAVFWGYLAASLVSAINLLFVIACVCFFSLFMPDFISVVFTAGILLVGFISDGGYLVINNAMVRSLAMPAVNAGPALWRVLYPKVFMVQAYADSIIGQSRLNSMGPVHPMLNLAFYILLVTALLLIIFNKKEI
jgi:ABC-type transport system involved in multi-copper enzyme maturation permease subunit